MRHVGAGWQAGRQAGRQAGGGPCCTHAGAPPALASFAPHDFHRARGGVEEPRQHWALVHFGDELGQLPLPREPQLGAPELIDHTLRPWPTHTRS